MSGAPTVPILPPLGALQALVALKRCGSLTAAARELGVTRSALSHRIADLEQRLGVALLCASGRTVVLTEDAEALVAAMGDAVDRIEAAVAPLRRQRQQLRISTVATFASHWLIPRLPEFQAEHPRVELMITTTTRVADLKREDIDGAIRHGRGRWTGVESVLLFRETLLPVAAPGIAARLSKRGFARTRRAAPLIHARSRFLDWQRWWTASGESAVTRDGGIIVENRAQALEAALAGSGIALVDAAYVRGHLAQGRLQALALKPLRLPEGYYFVHRPQPRNARAVAAFRAWLIAASEPFRDET